MKHILKFKVLSPVHIGDGTDLELFDYVIKDRKLYKIYLYEYLSTLEGDLLSKLKEYQLKNEIIEIRKLIRENIDVKNFKEYEADVSENVQKIYNEKFDEPKNQLIMNPFIRTNGKPYIPGSSIKGAIRTAILNYLDEGKVKSNKKDSKFFEGFILYAWNSENKYYDMSKDPFRSLKIRDTLLPNGSTEFMLVSNYRKVNSSVEKTGITIIKEVIKPGTEIEIEFILDRDVNKKVKLDLDLIMKASDKFYKEVLQSEKERLFKGNKQISEVYDRILDETKDGVLLRIGFNSGFESITLKNYREPKDPTKEKPGWGYSKDLVEDKYPFGWIKMVRI